MPSSNTKSVSKRIELLFSRFAVFYGHLWRSQFKSDDFLQFAKKEWETALKQFSDEVLNRAIIETRNYSDMPPTLPKFRKNCLLISTRYPVAEESKPVRQQNPEPRIACMAQCKKYLK